MSRKALALLLVFNSFLLIDSRENNHQQMVSSLVNAITKSGIQSGVSETHLKQVLNSDSLKANKATINVINIVPKNKRNG